MVDDDLDDVVPLITWLMFLEYGLNTYSPTELLSIGRQALTTSIKYVNRESWPLENAHGHGIKWTLVSHSESQTLPQNPSVHVNNVPRQFMCTSLSTVPANKVIGSLSSISLKYNTKVWNDFCHTKQWVILWNCTEGLLMMPLIKHKYETWKWHGLFHISGKKGFGISTYTL